MAIVYIHMKPQNRDIFYVGIGNDIKRAYRNEGRNDHWTKVYNKYGKIVDIICDNISLEAAKEMEKFMIASIGRDKLCNKTLGGEGFFGGTHTEEVRKRISIANKNKILSEETRRKLSEKSKGHPNYLKSHTEEAKKKLSIAFKGKKRSEYFCQRAKESKKGYRPHPSSWENAAKLKKENAVLIKELSTGFVGKIWEMVERFDIQKQAVYTNYKHDKPISKFKWAGLNFVKL